MSINTESTPLISSAHSNDIDAAAAAVAAAAPAVNFLADINAYPKHYAHSDTMMRKKNTLKSIFSRALNTQLNVLPPMAQRERARSARRRVLQRARAAGVRVSPAAEAAASTQEPIENARAGSNKLNWRSVRIINALARVNGSLRVYFQFSALAAAVLAAASLVSLLALYVIIRADMAFSLSELRQIGWRILTVHAAGVGHVPLWLVWCELATCVALCLCAFFVTALFYEAPNHVIAYPHNYTIEVQQLCGESASNPMVMKRFFERYGCVQSVVLPLAHVHTREDDAVEQAAENDESFVDDMSNNDKEKEEEEEEEGVMGDKAIYNENDEASGDSGGGRGGTDAAAVRAAAVSATSNVHELEEAALFASASADNTRKHSGFAFVTFTYEHEARNALNSLMSFDNNCVGESLAEYGGDGTLSRYIMLARSPEDMIWSNLHYSHMRRRFSLMWSFVISLLLSLLPASLLVITDYLRHSNFAFAVYLQVHAPLALSALFAIVTMIVQRSVDLLCRTLVKRAGVASHGVVQVYTILCAVFVRLGTLYSVGVGIDLGRELFGYAQPYAFFSGEYYNVVVQPLLILVLLDFSWHSWKFFVVRRLRACVAGLCGRDGGASALPEFDVTERASSLVNVFVVCLSYGFIVPILPLLGILALFVRYQLDKYRLLCHSKTPKAQLEYIAPVLAGLLVFGVSMRMSQLQLLAEFGNDSIFVAKYLPPILKTLKYAISGLITVGIFGYSKVQPFARSRATLCKARRFKNAIGFAQSAYSSPHCESFAELWLRRADTDGVGRSALCTFYRRPMTEPRPAFSANARVAPCKLPPRGLLNYCRHNRTKRAIGTTYLF